MVHSQSLEEKFCFFPFAIQLMVGLRIASEFCEENQKGIIYLQTTTYFFHLSWQAWWSIKGTVGNFSTCNYFWQIQIEVRNWKFSTIGWKVWQYKLWSFQMGGTKLEIFLPKNQHTQRKVSNFENRSNGEVSKCAKSWLSKSIF